jgi:hypothetical protein
MLLRVYEEALIRMNHHLIITLFFGIGLSIGVTIAVSFLLYYQVYIVLYIILC